MYGGGRGTRGNNIILHHLLEPMAQKKYRIEVSYPSRGNPKYYLVKDVWFRNRKRKVKKYLGVIQPTHEQVDHYRKKYAYWMELQAAKKKAEISSALFTSTVLTRAEISKLEEMRHIYSAFKSFLTVNEIEAYEQDFSIHYIQGTTAIEGNTLTLDETAHLLLHGIIPRTKSLREINEIQNYKRVIKYSSKYTGKITIGFIRDIHELVMNNIDNESAGQFRRMDDICISGCQIPLAPAPLIETELEMLLSQYYKNITHGVHPFEEAVRFHYEFEIIHPFSDGNGRVGREIFNCMIAKEGYPKMLFLGKDRETYIQALIHGNDDDYGKMVRIFTEIVFNQRIIKVSQALEKVVQPPPSPRPRQLSLSDFIHLS